MGLDKLTALARRIDELEVRRRSLVIDHQAALQTLDLELTEAKGRFEVARHGLDNDTIQMAKEILHVRGSYSRGGQDRASVIRDAIRDLAKNGGSALVRSYFGTKDYASWHGQREDHEYGYGPRHGSTIFAIGLSQKTIQRIKGGQNLDDIEIGACLYYLSNIEEIQRLESTGAKAA